jgi:hypothetical protein
LPPQPVPASVHGHPQLPFPRQFLPQVLEPIPAEVPAVDVKPAVPPPGYPVRTPPEGPKKSMQEIVELEGDEYLRERCMHTSANLPDPVPPPCDCGPAGENTS